MIPAPSLSASVSSFADYFKLNLDVDQIVGWFGYTFEVTNLTLPRSSRTLPWVSELQTRIESTFPHISLTNETARREFLIAPVLLDLARHLDVKIRVEYPVEVTERLRGTLDYYLQADHNLLIIEAKNADLQRGFTQLAVELIALDQASITENHCLYGAISLGNIWQFGQLDRTTKLIEQDLNLFRVPADLVDLVAILAGILIDEPNEKLAHG